MERNDHLTSFAGTKELVLRNAVKTMRQNDKQDHSKQQQLWEVQE